MMKGSDHTGMAGQGTGKERMDFSYDSELTEKLLLFSANLNAVPEDKHASGVEHVVKTSVSIDHISIYGVLHDGLSSPVQTGQGTCLGLQSPEKEMKLSNQPNS